MTTISELLNNRYSPGDFVFFWGHEARKDGDMRCCLSQWYRAPMVVDGIYYHCMEQYLMAEKARTFGDDETLALIMAEYSQMNIKKLGRRVSNYDNNRWESIRQQVSVKGNMAKFSQNPVLGRYLLSTGDKILVEASPKDSIWGIGLTQSHPDAAIPSRWPGLNLLGFALMEVRHQLVDYWAQAENTVQEKEISQRR